MQWKVALGVGCFVVIMVVLLFSFQSKSRASRVSTVKPYTPQPIVYDKPRGAGVSEELQTKIRAYLKSAVYQPFASATMSGARLMKKTGTQETYSVMVCSGNALDHIAVLILDSSVVPQFSNVRQSFALPQAEACIRKTELDTLQDLCFACSDGTPRDPFDCKLEFGDNHVVKISVPLEQGGPDASSHVIQADYATRVVLLDYIERESDLLRPSSKHPSPPGTLDKSRNGSISGIDNKLFWDTDHVYARAHTARPREPWSGLRTGDFYGSASERPT